RVDGFPIPDVLLVGGVHFPATGKRQGQAAAQDCQERLPVDISEYVHLLLLYWFPLPGGLFFATPECKFGDIVVIQGTPNLFDFEAEIPYRGDTRREIEVFALHHGKLLVFGGNLRAASRGFHRLAGCQQGPAFPIVAGFVAAVYFVDIRVSTRIGSVRISIAVMQSEAAEYGSHAQIKCEPLRKPCAGFGVEDFASSMPGQAIP